MMKSNIAVKIARDQESDERTAHVTAIEEHKERRIERELNSVVHVRGRGNVLVKELFCPNCSGAVVIRRKGGSYVDPCDFSSYLLQRKKANQGRTHNGEKS